MNTATPDGEDLHRIADALERIANHLAPQKLDIQANVHPTATKDDFAKTVVAAIREAEKRGTISPNWNAS